MKWNSKKIDRGGIYALTQRMMAYNSNKIEGSTLTEKQTASLFDTGTLSSEDAVIRAKDVEEMTGHFLMFNEMLKTYDLPLSHELIKRYHYKLKSGVFEDLANGYPVGEYKNRRNMVSDIVTAMPEEVEGRMTELLEWYHALPQHTLADLAKFHADYEAIHPFQDGNGRTGRIIPFKECLKNDIVPFIIRDDRKVEYYHALNAAQTKGAYGALNSSSWMNRRNIKRWAEGFVVPIERTSDRRRRDHGPRTITAWYGAMYLHHAIFYGCKYIAPERRRSLDSSLSRRRDLSAKRNVFGS